VRKKKSVEALLTGEPLSYPDFPWLKTPDWKNPQFYDWNNDFVYILFLKNGKLDIEDIKIFWAAVSL
jgi:hypothetical protein